MSSVSAHDESGKAVRAARKHVPSAKYGVEMDWVTLTFGDGIEVIVHSKDTAYLDALAASVEGAAKTSTNQN